MPTNPITTRLIQAILTRAREVDGHVTKTKLLKYLYLFDLEWYRRKRALLTGLPWMFHLYGPWAREFEALYSELAKDGVIRVRPFSSGDLEGERVDTPERVALANVVTDPEIEQVFRRIVDTWADKPVGQMLDYVYFHTEPMQSAVRGSALSFDGVDHEGQEVFPIAGEQDPKAITEMRRSIAERRRTTLAPSTVTPPPYDEVYVNALAIMDEDDDD